MGSFLDHAKGDSRAPLISRVIEHNRRYNEAVEKRWDQRPWWIKVLFTLGYKKISYRWELKQPLDLCE